MLLYMIGKSPLNILSEYNIMPRKKFQKAQLMDYLPLHVVNKSMNDTFKHAKRTDARSTVYYVDGKRFDKNRHILMKLWKRDEKKYRSAQLARYNGSWWLAYEGKASTGGFKTKHDAIDWFRKNGR